MAGDRPVPITLRSPNQKKTTKSPRRAMGMLSFLKVLIISRSRMRRVIEILYYEIVKLSGD